MTFPLGDIYAAKVLATYNAGKTKFNTPMGETR